MFDEGGPPVTARRIMGTEVEYGISVPGDPTANPVITSTQVVLAYAAAADIPRSRRARWDYEVESPLRDARGFDLSAPVPAPPRLRARRPRRRQRHPDQRRPALRRPRPPGVLHARGHQPARRRDLGQGGGAGDGGGRRCGPPPCPARRRSSCTRTTSTARARSYGTHENYLMPPADHVPVDRRRAHAVLRVPAGVCRRRPGRASGRPATRPATSSPSAADYIEVEVGLETTLKRGIINTRDEPHADADKYRRLHVIIGDANLAEYSHAAQARHRRAGARHDRGGRPVRRAAPVRAGALACTGSATTRP